MKTITNIIIAIAILIGTSLIATSIILSKDKQIIEYDYIVLVRKLHDNTEEHSGVYKPKFKFIESNNFYEDGKKYDIPSETTDYHYDADWYLINKK